MTPVPPRTGHQRHQPRLSQGAGGDFGQPDRMVIDVSDADSQLRSIQAVGQRQTEPVSRPRTGYSFDGFSSGPPSSAMTPSLVHADSTLPSPAQVSESDDASAGPRSAPQLPLPPRPVIYTDDQSERDPRFGSYDPRKSSEHSFCSQKDIPTDFPELGDLDCKYWTGKYVEDQLSEQIIKTGLADKPQLLTETNTARPSVWPHMKNRTGLQSLGAFFGSVLQQRQDCGMVVAASSFKPPPRVTLTDSKREAWLRDLADDKVPLRKLSRTIPHGVRGAALLEHCLAKRITLPRAIWLVKCVGANELRAFRRKGISGSVASANETMWVRDWTILVETFLQSCLDKIGGSLSKDSVLYLLRLVIELFAQNLLDRRHFMEWLAHELETCDVEKTPALVLLVDVLRRPFNQSMRPCQKLAKACAIRLHHMANTPLAQDLLRPINKRIRGILRTVCLSRPKAVLLGDEWSTCKTVIQSLGLGKDATTKYIEDAIETANERFLRNLDPSHGNKSFPCALADSSLDNFHPLIDVSRFTDHCMALCPDRRQLAITVLKWATSMHRLGDYRIYLATSVFRHMKQAGADVTEIITEVLTMMNDSIAISATAVGRIVSDLALSNDFDILRYLRTVMVGGSHFDSETQVLPLSMRPVLDLPLQCLTPQAASLRRMVLRSLGIVLDEDAVMSKAKSIIEASLQQPAGIVFEKQRLLHALDLLDADQGLNQAVSASLGSWIKQVVNDWVVDRTDGLEFQVKDIVILRSVLEKFGDYRTLGQLMFRLLEFSCLEATMAIADTIDRYFWEYAAMGKAFSLSSALLDRYRTLRTKHSPTRDMVSSIATLAARLKAPSVTSFVEREQELCQLNLGATVCTPASDSLVDLSQTSALTVEEEVERIFATGTTMDSQTLKRVFELIASRAVKSADDVQSSLMVANLFIKLRPYDQACFDDCMHGWITTQLRSATSILPQLVPELVGSDCLSLSKFADYSQRLCDGSHSSDDGSCAEVANRALAIITAQNRSPVMELSRTSYRYLTESRKMCDENPGLSLDVIRHAYCCDTSGSWAALSTNIRPVLAILRRNLNRPSKDSEPASWTFNLGADCAEPDLLTCDIVDPSGQLDFKTAAPLKRVEMLISKYDPLCLGAYRCILNKLMQESGADEEAIYTALTDGALIAVKQGHLRWQQLFTAADQSAVMQHIRETVEKTALSGIEQLMQSMGSIEDDVVQRIKAEVCLVQALASTVPKKGLATFGSTIAKAVQDIAASILNTFPEKSPVLQGCLQDILKLAVVHTRSFDPVNSSNANATTYLTTAASLLSARDDILDQSTRSLLYDTTAYFLSSFNLSDETLSNISTDIGAAGQDPDIRFLFGLHDQPNAWLHLTIATTSSRAPGGLEQQSTYFPVNPWEMIAAAAPVPGANDTALSLRLFGARTV